jgi:hypothetical protein
MEYKLSVSILLLIFSFLISVLKNTFKTFRGHWWLTPIILTTQEAEIRRIVV